jgi:WD40 repeat protein
MKKINEIKKAHYQLINNFRYCLDEKNNRDLILSLSSKDNNIKVWNIENWECIFDFKYFYKKGETYSVCFLKIKNQNYIVSSNSLDSPSIKVFNLNGKKVKTFDYSKIKIIYIDSYYDTKLNKNYIIICNELYVLSHDYTSNSLYHMYYEKGNNEQHNCIFIDSKEEIIKLIESSELGYIRIWNFHSGELLKKIRVQKHGLKGICLWNSEYIFIGCNNKKIILVNLKNDQIVKTFCSHKESVISIKKIFHPLYGECLISQGLQFGKIKLWINNIDYL